MAFTDTAFRNTKPADNRFKLADSAEPYLPIKPNSSTRWYMKYRINGKEKTLALAPSRRSPCHKARRSQEAVRNNRRADIDPAAVKQTEKS